MPVFAYFYAFIHRLMHNKINGLIFIYHYLMFFLKRMLALIYSIYYIKHMDAIQRSPTQRNWEFEENAMTNLNDLTVINAESNMEHGFFFVEFSNGKSLQCCLKALRQNEEEFFENGPIFLDQIEHDNSGFSDGLCADCNEWAVVDGEWGHILDFLVEKARAHGLQIVA